MKKIYISLFNLLNTHQKKRLLVLLLLMILGALLETLGISLILPVISVILDPDSIFSSHAMLYIYNFLGMESSRDFLIFLCVVLMAVYILKNIYLYFMYSVQYRFASNNRLQMSSRMFSIYLNKPYEFFLNKNAAEIVRNVNTDVANVFTLLTTLLQMLTEAVTAAGIVLVLFFSDYQMTIFVTVILLLATLVLKYILKPIQRITGIRARESDAESLKWLNESMHGIKDIKVNESETFFWRNFYHSGRISAEAIRKFSVVNTIPQMFIEVVFMVGMLSYILYLLFTGKDVSQLIPQISTFAMAAIRLLPIANRMNRYMGNITNLAPSLEAVEREMTGQSQIQNADRKEDKGQVPKLRDKISIQNVAFRYYCSDTWILKHAYLDIPIGSAVGIIGPSGSGKTTLIDLLLGLLQPLEGKILVDGTDIRELGELWLQKIGYVSQSMYLTEDSIEKNIAFGIPETEIDHQRVKSALKAACLDDFVEKLPQKEETKIGEFGAKISGGQKQRICIARALYYEPEVLILDEATSALDYDTENEIMENINHLKGKMTLIIIAHRLRTIENCDYLYKVTDKKIVRSAKKEN